jgi:hypothetical protein
MIEEWGVPVIRPLALVLLLGLAACRGTPAALATRTVSGDVLEDEVTEIIIGALNGEAAGETTDTLYTSSAVIVVNGRTRTLTPLFAGIGQGGQVAITSSQLEVRSGLSWGLVDYRWETRDGVVREGRASFILTQVRSGTWRIQHVHSSSPR